MSQILGVSEILVSFTYASDHQEVKTPNGHRQTHRGNIVCPYNDSIQVHKKSEDAEVVSTWMGPEDTTVDKEATHRRINSARFYLHKLCK